ncbi:hypothetical protein [Salibacterium salarium]|uniref:hypothetical protein n=1 Tax=Salibacterium salarium TaxID=284579 RepID=UPI0027D889EE|nr:hypothetical protein [Salibacterium salarium]
MRNEAVVCMGHGDFSLAETKSREAGRTLNPLFDQFSLFLIKYRTSILPLAKKLSNLPKETVNSGIDVHAALHYSFFNQDNGMNPSADREY